MTWWQVHPTNINVLIVSRRGTNREASLMNTIGLDLHKRESQLCISHDDGTITERRIATTKERFSAVLRDMPHARILLEASTESEWVARHLESLGHEVIVAGPNFAPMYATRSAHQDRQARCEDADGGLSARSIPSGSSGVRCDAACSSSARSA